MESPRRHLAVWFAVWLGLGCFFTVRAAWIAPTWSWNPENTRWVWANAAVFQISFYLLWGVFSLVAVRLARRWPLSGPGWPGHLLRHLPVGLATAALHLLVLLVPLFLANTLLAEGKFDFPGNLERAFHWHYHTDVAIYWLVLLSWEAMEFTRRADDRALAAARLAEQLAEARLSALRLQVRPQFVFDTLGAIGERMHGDVDASERLVLDLAAYLRSVLDLGDETTVPMREEVALLERYLAIERTRLGRTFRFAVDLDPRAALVPVPSFLLQPLVESAVRDAVAGEAAAFELDLAARAGREGLEIELRAVSRGSRPPEESALVGAIAATRTRLGERPSDGATIRLSDGERGERRVRLHLPFETSGASDAPSPYAPASGVRVWSRREGLA